MRLLILFVLSQYGLACKYRIIPQTSILDAELLFPIFLVLHFQNFEIKLQLVGTSQMVCHMMS